nr:phage holin [Bacillus safensis]
MKKAFSNSSRWYFLGITSLWAYWKNNDITKKARTKTEK